MAKLIPLGNNGGNENRPSDEELNQMFGAFMDAFFGGLSDEDIDEESTTTLYSSMNSTIPITGMTFMKVQPPSLIP